MTDQPDRDALPPDPSRRVFFRHLGRNAVHAAGNVVGTADLIRRGSAVAAGGLLGLSGLDAAPRATIPSLSTPDPGALSGELAANAEAVPGEIASSRSRFRSAYRVAGEELVILDQRALPAALADIVCRDARAVARAIRERAIEGAPVTAQVAAYALAMTARAVTALPPATRDAVLRQAAVELVVARPSSRPLECAVERMLGRWATGMGGLGPAAGPGEGGAPGGTEVAAEMREEADAIATDAMLDHATLARLAAAALPTPVGRPIGVLVHGSTGSLAGGQVGTALGVVAVLAGEARPVRVWVTESRPGLGGAGPAAWELDHLGAAFTVVPDAAAGLVLADEGIDVVLVGAERIARNGDVANTVGTLPIAATARALGVPLWVCAPSSTIDSTAPDGAWVRATSGAASTAGGMLFDITPARLVSALFTESGRAEPVTEERVVSAHAGRERRRLPRGSEVASATRHVPASPEAVA